MIDMKEFKETLRKAEELLTTTLVHKETGDRFEIIEIYPSSPDKLRLTVVQVGGGCEREMLNAQKLDDYEIEQPRMTLKGDSND